jgi:hypothetical protein
LTVAQGAKLENGERATAATQTLLAQPRAVTAIAGAKKTRPPSAPRTLKEALGSYATPQKTLAFPYNARYFVL